MKTIGHGPLECCASIFETERHNTIGKSASWGSKSGLVLVFLTDLYLIISRKTVHEGEDFMPRTRIDELVIKWRGEIVFWTSAV